MFEKKRKAEEQARALLKKEGYTAEDDQRADKFLEEARLYESQIEKLKAVEAEEAREAEKELEKKNADPKKKEYRLGETFTKYALGQISERELRAAATQTTGTGSSGGYTIPEGWMKQIKEAMLAYGGMYANSYVFRTASGNDLPMPKINDTSNKAFLVSESTSPASSASNAALTFGTQTFKAYKYTSGLINVPVELLQDADISPELEAFIVTALKERMWRGMNYAFTQGAGTTDIHGIVHASADSGVTVASSAITRDNLIGLLHSVDPAYRIGGKFMFNDATLLAIKKLSFGDSDNRPLWQPGIYAGAPDTLEGKPYVINQDMDDIGTGNRSVLFGDFANYYIREVADWRLVRMDERYAEVDQVAFALFARYDGQLVNAGTNPVKCLRHANT